MIRVVLLLCAGILLPAVCACAPAESNPLAPTVSGPTVVVDCTSAQTFAASIQLLSPTFDPTVGSGTPTSAGPPAPSVTSDLAAAYNLAPWFFQTQLCGLSGIFIAPATQNSWGYRNFQDGRRYIALSMNLWPGTTPTAITLDRYEDAVFGPPLSWPTPTSLPINDPSPPVYGPAMPNNNGPMMVLAALAHEFGHVFWADVLIPLDPSNPGRPSSSKFCNKILTNYWSGGVQASAPPQWRTFEAEDTNAASITPDDATDPDGSPQEAEDAKIGRLRAALGSQSTIPKAHKILGRILAKGRPFPSLLGAFSANEQFVESFMLYTLMRATPPLTSLPLQVTAGVPARDIPADLKNGQRKRLAKVLACFDHLVPPAL